MSQEFSVVGRRLPRLDGIAKATGEARYGTDIKLPGMLTAKVLRSPYPHAKVVKIDTSKAEKLPGVEAIITLEDAVLRKALDLGLTELPPPPPGTSPRQRLYIFSDRARYVGEPIAAIAATSKSVAEEALGLIEVEYEKLPAVFDPIKAMEPDAPLVHRRQRNIGMHASYPFAEGDVEKAFQEADCIVEETFHTSKQAHCQLEPYAVAASFNTDGKLTVWTPCQLAHLGRRQIAHIFDMPVGMVKLVNPYVGGSFGGKLLINDEPICIALAKKAGKPVKLEHTREEDLVALETRTPFIYQAKLGFTKDGTLIATQMKVVGHSGGYLQSSSLAVEIFMALGMGNYRCPNKAAEADIVYTNTTLSGSMRGFGNPAAVWGLEQLMDMAAEKLRMDPVELRLKNIKQAGETAMGLPIQSTALDECIRIGAEKIGWQENRLRESKGIIRRGVGMATMSHCSGSQPLLLEHSNAFIKLNEDGSANLTVHPGECGQGILGVLAQIAAEELGLRVEDIHIITGDTDITMFDIGSHASRSTYIIGNAVLRAAREAKAQLLERAAKMLGVSPDELEAKDRQIYVRATPEQGISVAKVAHDAIYNFNHECLNISGKCSFAPTTYSPSTQAAFAEVEVDTETGEVKVVRMVVVHDIGRAINPMNVEGQLEGGVVQGIGFALTEDYVIDQDTGILLSDNFTTYKLPSTLDLPQIDLVLVERPDPAGPFGAKGVGEAGLVTIAPAIANAIYNASGVRITELPMTPEKILSALKTK